tara:strand:- start:2989 stop:3228 length:240 start_codon:yes stop_codon:yes gene_type:complete
MRVEITRNVMINGESVKAGSFVEVELGIANLLIGSDKAKLSPEPEPKPEPKLEIQQKPVKSEPKPAARRGRPKTTSGDD